MRDNAKASSDRSSFGRSALLGLFGRAFATRSASSDGQGSGAPSLVPVRELAVRGGLLGLVCLCLLGLAAFLGTAPAAIAAEACSNEARRAEQSSTFLPECRAYELVTPEQKGSGEPLSTGVTEEAKFELQPMSEGLGQIVLGAGVFGARAGVGGTRMAWSSPPLPESGSAGNNNLSARATSGWSSQGMVPPMSPYNDLACPPQLGIAGWSSDLGTAVLSLPAGTPSGFSVTDDLECGHDEPRLVPDEPEHLRNLFVHEVGSGSYRLINVTPPNVTWPEPEETFQRYWPASFLAGSDDLSHVVFEEELKLTPDAPIGYRGGDELYEWANGQVRLVTYLPSGIPVQGSLAGATRNYFPVTGPVEPTGNIAQFRHAVSSSGSRVFFEAGGNLYVRVNSMQSQSSRGGSGECTELEMACTAQVDEAKAGAPGPSGGGKFQAANAEGTRVFFTDAGRLTADSTAASGKPDLYEYDTGTGALTDLTTNATEPANVLGVVGASEDGSYLYFVAKTNLTGGQLNSYGATALGPATGTGTLIGPAHGTGSLTAGSSHVTSFHVTSGGFHIGQEIEGEKGEGLPAGTTITACSPTCSSPTEVTLSHNATADKPATFTLTGLGEFEVTGLNTSTGAFEVGMTITGTGVPAGTWIKAVGSGTLTLSSRATTSGSKALSATAANLYVRHAGATTFITSLNAEGGDQCDWITRCLTARVSGSGTFIGFNSIDSLTGYDNTYANTGERVIEIYLYDAATDRIHCVSCIPTGAQPPLGAAIRSPARQNLAKMWANLYPQRNVSDRGQVFFETTDALVPRDTNGRRDVYEWEQPGVGTCTEASPAFSSQEVGCIYLLSSGTSETGSHFLDATPNGSDVFISTAQQLLPRDTDTVFDYYDVREGGGFAEPPGEAAPCEGEACKGAVVGAPTFGAPGSLAFTGSGNLPAPVSKKPAVKRLTNAQKLARALKACKRKPQRQRSRCQAQARKRYGAKKARRSTSRRAAR